MPAPPEAVAKDQGRADNIGRVSLRADDPLDDRGREHVRRHVALLRSSERARRIPHKAALTHGPLEEVDPDGAHLPPRSR